MPGNTVKINNSDKLEWYIGDSQMDFLITVLNHIGTHLTDEDRKVVK